MNRFLDTTGRSVVAIAICQMCQRKMAHADVVKDPNTGLRGHFECTDEVDPYTLPDRPVDRIALSFVLPDTSVVTTVAGSGQSTIPGGGTEEPPPGGTGGDFSDDFNNDFSGGVGTTTPPPDEEEPGGGNGAGDFGTDYNSDFS